MTNDYRLSWQTLWRLFRLRLLNPKRAKGVIIRIVDYNMRANDL